MVLEDLRANGAEIVVLDYLSWGHRAAVAHEIKFYEGDISDDDLVRRICTENQIEATMYFSAFAYVGESVEKPAMYYHNKTMQTLRFLDELIACDVRLFVFSSTCATNGELQYVPIDEKHPQNLANPCGWSKFFC